MRTPLLSLLTGALLVPAVMAACGASTPGPKPVEPMVSAPPSGSASSPDVPYAPSAMASVEPAPLPPPPPRITSKKASEKKDPSYAACHKPYVPTAHDANIVGDVTRMAKMCETATGLKKLVAKKDGKQQDQSAPQDLAFRAEKGKCYRVYAQAESTIEDLDLALVDSEKNIAGEDTTDDSSPVVGEDSVICFSEADSALVRISVGRGGGRWAVQIWGN